MLRVTIFVAGRLPAVFSGAATALRACITLLHICLSAAAMPPTVSTRVK